MQAFQGRVLFIFSSADLTAQEFLDMCKASPSWQRLLAKPSVQQHTLDGADHTFSRRAWRDQVADWTGGMGGGMVKRVLMVAFHFPPLRGSSGIQRALKFVQYLPALGWQPLVLSAHPRAYVNQGPDQMAEIPPEAVVKRAFAIDAGRHLGLARPLLRLHRLARPLRQLVPGRRAGRPVAGAQVPARKWSGAPTRLPARP